MKRFNVLAGGNDASALAAQIEASKKKEQPKPARRRAIARPNPGVTVKGEVVVVDKATVTLNPAFNGVEIRFPCALPEPTAASLRLQGFRYCKFKAGTKRDDRQIDKRWYARHTDDREAFARQLAEDFNAKVADPQPATEAVQPAAVVQATVKPAPIRVTPIHIKHAATPKWRARLRVRK